MKLTVSLIISSDMAELTMSQWGWMPPSLIFIHIPVSIGTSLVWLS